VDGDGGGGDGGGAQVSRMNGKLAVFSGGVRATFKANISL